MRRLALAILVLGLAALAAGLWLTRPAPLPADRLAGLMGDPARGEAVFWAGGCASCHARPGASGEALLVLAGGEALETPFGTFRAPNISPDLTHGIGGWSAQDFAAALLLGVSPEGRHYYPSFPYTSYAHMTGQDVLDLWSFLRGLPADATPNRPHDLAFPFTIRRGIGLWKRLYLSEDWVMAETPSERGRYLVEGPGHCGECHTPRDSFGGLDTARWMAGAPNPTGQGRIPGLTPDQLAWSAADIAYYLETGFTPDFDSAGGHMARVVANIARLPASDRQAIAAYIKALAPVEQPADR